MENEFNPDLTDDSNNDSSVKYLEDFFSKDVSTFLTPQEMLVMSLSLKHIAQVITLYSNFTNVAVFDVKKFIKDHPEYAHTDFNNPDEDTMEAVRQLLTADGFKDHEEFNTGDILLKSIIGTIYNIGEKLRDAYDGQYDKIAPEDSVQFFAMLENCLNSAGSFVQSFLMQQRF